MRGEPTKINRTHKRTIQTKLTRRLMNPIHRPQIGVRHCGSSNPLQKNGITKYKLTNHKHNNVAL